MINILFSFITLTFLTAFCSIALGSLFKDFIIGTQKKDKNYTLASFWGLIILIFFYSTFQTQGKTINIFLLFPITLLALKKHKKPLNKIKVNWIPILKASLKFTLTFCLVLTLSIFWNYNSSINNDIIYYSNIGNNLNAGIENHFHYFNNVIPSDKAGLFPYHYFEMWLQSLLSNFTGSIPSVIVLKFLVYSYFKTYIILGIDSILLLLKRSFSLNILLITLISLLPFEDYLNLFNPDWKYYLSFWKKPNFIIYLFAFIPFTLYTLDKKYFISVIILLTLPIISTVTAPPIFLFIPFYILSLFVLKLLNRIEVFYLFSTTIFMALFILLFYHFFGVKLKTLSFTQDFILTTYSNSWKAMLYYIFILPATTLLLTIPLTALFITSKKNNNQINLILYSGIMITTFGVIIFQAGYFIDNFYQFPFIGYSFIYLIAIILLSATITSLNKPTKVISLLILLVGLFFSKKDITIPLSMNFSENDIQLIKFINTKKKITKQSCQLLMKNKNIIKGKGFYILGKDATSKIAPLELMIAFNQYPNFLYYLNKDIELYPLIDRGILYKNEIKDDIMYSKAHSFNDLLPKVFFDNDLKTTPLLVKKYNISFLFIDGIQKTNEMIKLFPKAKQIELDNNQTILVLKGK